MFNELVLFRDTKRIGLVKDPTQDAKGRVSTIQL